LSDRPSFARTLSVRITLVALAAIVLQLLVVVVINDFDYETLYLDHINYEASALLKGVSIGPDGPAFVLPSKLTQFRDDTKAAYAFRVLDTDGRVIAAHNGELLESVHPGYRTRRKQPITGSSSSIRRRCISLGEGDTGSAMRMYSSRRQRWAIRPGFIAGSLRTKHSRMSGSR
jgi:hypothetical protein